MKYLHEGNIRYLANNITEEVHNNILHGDKLNIILGNTGIGKSVYITKDVIKYYQDRKEEVLILCNRTALRNQFMNDLKELYGEEIIGIVGKSTEKELIILENVTVMSYQNLEKIIQEKGSYDLNLFKHIFCDESQYFNVDCFNGTTDISYNAVIDYFKNGGKLTFMTATGDLIIQQLTKDLGIEKLNVLNFNDSSKYKCNWNDRLNIEVTSHNYMRFIEEVPADEKLLIFMNGKQEMINMNTFLNRENLEKNGYNLEELSEGQRIDLLSEFNHCNYVHSAWELVDDVISCNKSMITKFNRINENGLFSSKILIANSSMDNGVSLKLTDSNPDRRRLGAIIIKDSICDISLIQKIGRARQNPNNPDDVTNIKVSISREAITKQLGKNYFELEMLDDFYSLSKEEFKEKYDSCYIDKNGKAVSHIIKKVERIERKGFCEEIRTISFELYDLFKSYIEYNTKYLEGLLVEHDDVNELNTVSFNQALYLKSFYNKYVELLSGDTGMCYEARKNVDAITVFNTTNFNVSQDKIQKEINKRENLNQILEGYIEDEVIFVEEEKVILFKEKGYNVKTKEELKLELKSLGIENRGKAVSKKLINKNIKEYGFEIEDLKKFGNRYWKLNIA